MADNILLQGTVKWSYDYEMAEISDNEKAMASVASFTPPLHRHEGNIALTDAEIIIEGVDGDDDLTIQLGALKQIYLGFDDLFPVAGLGMLWRPLRIEYYVSAVQVQSIYLVIDFNGVFTHDKDWYNTLTEMLR